MNLTNTIHRVVTSIIGVGFLTIGAIIALIGYKGGISVGVAVVSAGVLFTTGIGLLLMWFWIRRAVAIIIVLIAIIVPAGYINPFSAMEMPNPPLVADILVWMIPLVALLLFVAWAVDPPKKAQPNYALERTDDE